MPHRAEAVVRLCQEAKFLAILFGEANNTLDLLVVNTQELTEVLDHCEDMNKMCIA